jgi:hypothetical protein
MSSAKRRRTSGSFIRAARTAFGSSMSLLYQNILSKADNGNFGNACRLDSGVNNYAN